MTSKQRENKLLIMAVSDDPANINQPITFSSRHTSWSTQKNGVALDSKLMFASPNVSYSNYYEPLSSACISLLVMEDVVSNSETTKTSPKISNFNSNAVAGKSSRP